MEPRRQKPKQEKDPPLKQGDKTDKENRVETPPPPQVVDPSRPPGQGDHETYEKESDG